jgi:hypothetical protein
MKITNFGPILSIFDKCPDTTHNDNHGQTIHLMEKFISLICSKLYKFKHGHGFFFTLDCKRPKNIPRGAKKGMEELIY